MTLREWEDLPDWMKNPEVKEYYEIDNKGRMVIKKLYLDPFLDMFNGEVLSYGISKTHQQRAFYRHSNKQ